MISFLKIAIVLELGAVSLLALFALHEMVSLLLA